MNPKIFLILALSILFLSCSENKNQEKELNSGDIQVGTSGNLPVITFESLEYDFGKITQGEVVSVDFHFRNTGKANLIISGASGSCGCTVPKWPKEPIAPNKTGIIHVVFDSEGKRGYQEKTITVATNCEPATILLKIKGEIIVPETIK